ncbi:glucose-1-phosphate cytidylyltransferase [Stakelama marina]|uniref:Glucose-1-phosphate cytidylyltransferase n=1 Tax=Stakelama marina TaxID=2826939 RepID=A0A8T4IIU6_9SPHN|nr:glucose-1-phosphate cytidylyltransferase [Stakelama marina]MBR0552106.1 glucose-1-phosphate cytidylyltransferase [Stakelama marina]
MQVVLLCGGKGTRLGEVTGNSVPKPMVQIGSSPILWHIMQQYDAAGYRDFVICAGHLSWSIKEYFLNFHAQRADVTISTAAGRPVKFHDSSDVENWNVTIAETGEETMTAGRVKRIAKYIDGDDFMLTYGDGVANVDLNALVEFHKSHGKMMTMTGVIPPGRFGELVISGDQISEMNEKPMASDRYINGGFMVVKKAFIERFLSGDVDDIMLEREPMMEAAKAGEMMLFRHNGFWQCMDTLRDWQYLNALWNEGRAPWSRDR